MNAAIAIDGLTKDYDGVRALDGLTLKVQPGEIFGFLGPNGAGKTTTIRLLLDLIRPTAGSATILGQDCQAASHRARERTSYLPGDVRLYPGKTGWETVELVGGLRGHAPDRGYVRALATTLDLDMDKHAGALSKGNRQKLGLLLTLFDRPAVFLLDEPTSGLDPISQRVVWDLLRQEAARGATIFFSSHVMSEVEAVCERVAILRAGRLVAVEPIAALKERSLRRIEITFAAPVPPRAFVIGGVRELERRGNTVWLEVPGHLDEVVKAIARYPVVDLRTEQASLDDILLTFYRGAPS
jgi:ABC-2 type transport system ATP-binding protein